MHKHRTRSDLLEEQLAHLIHILTGMLDLGLVDDAKAFLAEQATTLPPLPNYRNAAATED